MSPVSLQGRLSLMTGALPCSPIRLTVVNVLAGHSRNCRTVLTGTFNVDRVLVRPRESRAIFSFPSDNSLLDGLIRLLVQSLLPSPQRTNSEGVMTIGMRGAGHTLRFGLHSHATGLPPSIMNSIWGWKERRLWFGVLGPAGSLEGAQYRTVEGGNLKAFLWSGLSPKDPSFFSFSPPSGAAQLPFSDGYNGGQTINDVSRRPLKDHV